jgi:hypothetical protein
MKRRVLIGSSVVALIVAAVVAVASAASGGVYAGPGHTNATNTAAARADASKLLAAIQLPPGAVRSSVEPAGGGRYLARPAGYPATPNLVDRHGWWTIPGDPATVLAYLNSHAPPGSKLDGSSTLEGPNIPTVNSVQYDWSQIPNVLSTRSLVVEVMSLPDHMTGVRADAQDVWASLRSDSERVPAGVDGVRVTLTRGGTVKQGPYRFTSRGRVRAAARIIDSLPVSPPGTISCPVDFGYDLRLEFYRAGATVPAAVADVDPGGCGTVRLTVAGRTYPALAAGLPQHRTATQRLERALGVHFNTGP